MEYLPPQPWMSAPATRAVIGALTAGGSEVRFVGGCVRDGLLGRAVTDIDIATPDGPARVIELLEAAGLKAVPTGIEYGTVTAVALHHPFEITTLRRDVENYGRRAKVTFTDDWTADAARRDFTFNALSCAPDGKLYDPFGGIADLQGRRVRFVGEAMARIREDVLRLLRFFRFYAHYGAPPPDGDALGAARAMAPLLPTLSGERIAGETLKLLAATDPAAVMTLMRDHVVLMHFLPEAERLDRLARLVAIETKLGLVAAPARRLAAALAGGEGCARAVAGRLRLSNTLRDRIVGALGSARTDSRPAACRVPGAALSAHGRDLSRPLPDRQGRERCARSCLARHSRCRRLVAAGVSHQGAGRTRSWRDRRPGLGSTDDRNGAMVDRWRFCRRARGLPGRAQPAADGMS